MKAISTHYLGATNYRGSRIVATDADNNRVSRPYGNERDTEAEHRAAAEALRDKMGWKGELIGGGTKDGMCWVFANQSRTPAFNRNPSGVRIVHNKLLGGWYVVRGPHQTPLNGRFDSKAEAQAWLSNRSNVTPRVQMYQPKTGQLCTCRPGIQRDNCTLCEGTGQRVDFAAIRARRNPIKGPGKFEGETYLTRFAYYNVDDELGDVEGFGWYGRMSGKVKGRGPFHVIVSESSQGFVYGNRYDTENEMMREWHALEREYEKFTEGQPE